MQFMNEMCNVSNDLVVFYSIHAPTLNRLQPPYMYLPSRPNRPWLRSNWLHPAQQHLSDQQPLCQWTVCGECVRHVGMNSLRTQNECIVVFIVAIDKIQFYVLLRWLHITLLLLEEEVVSNFGHNTHMSESSYLSFPIPISPYCWWQRGTMWYQHCSHAVF